MIKWKLKSMKSPRQWRNITMITWVKSSMSSKILLKLKFNCLKNLKINLKIQMLSILMKISTMNSMKKFNTSKLKLITLRRQLIKLIMKIIWIFQIFTLKNKCMNSLHSLMRMIRIRSFPISLKTWVTFTSKGYTEVKKTVGN